MRSKFGKQIYKNSPLIIVSFRLSHKKENTHVGAKYMQKLATLNPIIKQT